MRPPLTKMQIAARKRCAKLHRINRLCVRLDAAVASAEKLKSGKTKKAFEQLAEKIRAELKEVDH